MGGGYPKGRKTEDGRLPDKYRLQETKTISYAQRTELNVVDSDGTLILSHGKLTGGSSLTQTVSTNHRKPCLHIDLNEIHEPKAVQIISSWIDVRGIKTLNVTGPRPSKDAQIYDATKRILLAVLQPPPDRILAKWPRTVEEAVERLLSELPLRDKTNIANMTEQGLASLHPMLGQYIRNRFGLWAGNQDLMASCRFVSGKKDLHEDDGSAVIIKELWRKLRKNHVLRVVRSEI